MDHDDAAYVPEYFADGARTYDQRERRRRRMRSMLPDVAAVQPGESVLDVCTGAGAAFALAERGARVTGIDLSLDQISPSQASGGTVSQVTGRKVTWSIVNIKCRPYTAGVQHRAGAFPRAPSTGCMAHSLGQQPLLLPLGRESLFLLRYEIGGFGKHGGPWDGRLGGKVA